LLTNVTYTRLLGDGATFLSNRQSFDSFNHEVPWEITANKADHLVVVQPCYRVVVGGRVEHFSDLLQKALSVELCG